jgi:Stress responsive A/B Barrel Domain
VLRHTALFLLRETTPEPREAMLRRLASLLLQCPTVRGGDYGDRLSPSPAPGGYDVALHLDFDDAAGYDAYRAHPIHVAAAALNASLSVPESTVRIDWRYGGPPRVGPDRVRHCEVLAWSGAAPAGARATALDAARALARVEGVLSAVVAEDSGGDARASDWILDVELSDEPAARAFLAGAAYREAAAAIARAVDEGRTARITHLERGSAAVAPGFAGRSEPRSE